VSKKWYNLFVSVDQAAGGDSDAAQPPADSATSAAGRLQFTASTAEGVRDSSVVFIAVPTPPQPDGSVDLSYIERVARDIAAAMTSYHVIVDKSTVPVKTGEKVAETIKRYATRYRVQVKGYTDTDEAKGHELELSRARAQRVTEYLTVSGGIPANAVESVGYGATNPLAPENTPSGQAKNRRAEVVLIIQK